MFLGTGRFLFRYCQDFSRYCTDFSRYCPACSAENVGYMAKSGPNGLIFGAIGTEFQGEANSGVVLASQYDFDAYL